MYIILNNETTTKIFDFMSTVNVFVEKKQNIQVAH